MNHSPIKKFWRHLAVLGWVLPGTANASSPNAVYSAPLAVDMLPDEATATRVTIRGAFTLLSGLAMTYAPPTCGVMYFQCPAGNELMCRMQWRELRATIGQGYCAGFGMHSMVTAAAVRADGAPLTNPDPWNLGMGISQGASNSVRCPETRALRCSRQAMLDAGLSGPDAAFVRGDAPLVIDAAVDKGAPADAKLTRGDSGDPTPDARLGAPSPGVALADAGEAKPNPIDDGGCGCHLGGSEVAVSGGFWVVVGLFLLGRRRRHLS